MKEIQEVARDIREAVDALAMARTADDETLYLARLERLAEKLATVTRLAMRQPSRFQ